MHILYNSLIFPECMVFYLNTTVQLEKDCKNPRCLVSSKLNSGIRCIAYIYHGDDFSNPVSIVNIEYNEKINETEAVLISDTDSVL